MLNLDLLKQLNKQNQWQYSKITRSPKVAHRLHSYFSQRIPEFSMEKAESEQKIEISFQGLHSNKGKYTDIDGFTTRNHSTSTTKRTAQGLIQGYKACYSLLLCTLVSALGLNQDISREKKNSLQEDMHDQEHRKSSSCIYSSP